MSSKQTSLPHYGVPDVEIESLLGQGRSYDEWKVRLKNHGYGGLWNENLKNIIIKREFEKFKTEILRLQAEPNEAPGGKDVQKTNSLESILKRLQGRDWANGKPNEKVQRMQDRRLLGKDAKIRALQKYVKEWKEIESTGASSNLERETPVAAYRSTNSGPSPASTPSSMQHEYGGTQPTVQNTAWDCQNIERSTYSSTCQLGSEKYNSQPFTSQSSNTFTSTSTSATKYPTKPAGDYQLSAEWSTPPEARATSLVATTASPSTNSMGGYQSSTAWSTTPETRATPQVTTNTTSFPDGTYPAASTEGYNAEAQQYWGGYQTRWS